jgi:hypothetical protein
VKNWFGWRSRPSWSISDIVSNQKAAIGGDEDRSTVTAAAELGPALIGKAIVALLTEDEMIQERDAQQFPGFAQPLGQDAIFLTWCTVSRGMIMGACDVKSL